MAKKPIVLLIFNRADLTRQVFQTIQDYQPDKLLIIADGPRYADEAAKCESARVVVESISWPCDVMKNYSDTNLGCRVRISTGLNWVFEQVDEAIVLEDDCIPDQSFFRFCEVLLDTYRDDKRIMHISGYNHYLKANMDEDYYFSKYISIWGWATWRRAWERYDADLASYPEFKRRNIISNAYRTPEERNNYLRNLDRVFSGNIDTWDYQWNYSIRIENGLCIKPYRNLVRNVGFRDDATHTKGENRSVTGNLANRQTFPLKHPRFMLPDEGNDYEYFARSTNYNLKKRIKNYIRRGCA